ncbi:hypothetical protein M2324_002922 [Rhodovulum sulfidophilum]|uniref:hypothetical protein n=1 Tax=Rhodovulum sulfidophilum TaxID=35806 RepID=UPI000A5CEE71|nr:hypothetical protein [Rhodovulum sulfidophilum]MCW2304512.1 hypothetical protein [Rhodovulum sulfidophilum]
MTARALTVGEMRAGLGNGFDDLELLPSQLRPPGQGDALGPADRDSGRRGRSACPARPHAAFEKPARRGFRLREGQNDLTSGRRETGDMTVSGVRDDLADDPMTGARKAAISMTTAAA